MAEVETEVSTFLVNLKCDLCGNIVSFIDTDSVRNDDGSYDVTYNHVCMNCGAEYKLPIQYPYTKYVQKM